MKHVIIGTAGHVDHGKTLLIKALTGIDTDRLAEEKKRGITIELGFAHLEFPDGSQAGIVDVPGHEKFIKNMLAGAGGIDLAMLVVAADEGFMPQTVEHLGILSLLGIQNGLVVLTKADLVDRDWLEMIREDVKERVKGTFLEGKPIMAVSAYTGEGLAALKEELQKQVAAIQEKNVRIPFRLPIDRVFTVEGFGTVVTGTLIEGCVHVGETAELLPAGLSSKVRSLQVHGKSVEGAYAGERVAMNLSNIAPSDIDRGETVCKPDTLRCTLMPGVKLTNLKNSGRVIENNSRVHFYHGSAVSLAKVVLLDRDALSPGESCFAQLRLTEKAAVKTGDRFVVRFYSPLETIGGGIVLDDREVKLKRGDEKALLSLSVREKGSEEEKLVELVREFGLSLPDTETLSQKLSLSIEETKEALSAPLSKGLLLCPLNQRYLAAALLDGIEKEGRKLLEAYHRENPLHPGMKEAEFRQKLFRNLPQSSGDAVLRLLCEEGKLKKTGARYALPDFEIRFTKRQKGLREKLLKAYELAGLEPDNFEELSGRVTMPQEKQDLKQVLDSLLSDGSLTLLTPQILYDKKSYDRAMTVLKALYEAKGPFTLGEYRDALGVSRKYALAFLESCDKGKITKKEGDLRKLL